MSDTNPIPEAIPTGDADPALAMARRREAADVERWFKRYTQARKFDEPARRQYAKDRRYARGDSGFEVDANLVGTNIDILESFLYARDPDFDVRPGRSMQPPTVEALRDAVEDQMEQSPEAMQAGAQAAAMAVAMGLPQDQALMAGQAAQSAFVEDQIQKQITELRKRYARRQRDIKSFSETIEVVGARMWQDAQLRRRGRPMVRSALTVGQGVLKASWQERTDSSPETSKAINDLQANIQKAQALKQQIAQAQPWGADPLASSSEDIEVKIADLERQLKALQEQADRVVARGYVVDNVAPENFQVAPGYTIANHCDAPWNADAIFMSYEDALGMFGPRLAKFAESGEPDSCMKAARRYRPRKPEMVRTESAMLDDESTASDADAYTEGDVSGEGGADWVRLVEFWDRDSNTVLTGIEGVRYWVKDQWTPAATTRFYPYFVFTTSEVDGQRHPQSLVTRTSKLVDEYNRIGSAEAEHRRRIKPKLVFNRGLLDPDDARKLERGETMEMIGIKPTQPNMDLRELLWPVAYAQMDPGLYDRQRIVNEIERIWGVQEALSGAVQVAKTATEADIQQQGFQARTGARRDALESMLSDLAGYTCEVARAYLTLEDVQGIVGPDAFWPQYTGPDEINRMVTVSIRAGSSGKPNTAAERQAWATQLPLLQSGIVQIGQLRQAAPAAIADSLEQLMRITAERSGDFFLDIDQLIPQAGDVNPMQQLQQLAAPAGGAEPAPAEQAPVDAGVQPPNPTL